MHRSGKQKQHTTETRICILITNTPQQKLLLLARLKKKNWYILCTVITPWHMFCYAIHNVMFTVFAKKQLKNFFLPDAWLGKACMIPDVSLVQFCLWFVKWKNLSFVITSEPLFSVQDKTLNSLAACLLVLYDDRDRFVTQCSVHAMKRFS